jgi:hypothetical protein
MTTPKNAANTPMRDEGYPHPVLLPILSGGAWSGEAQ